MRLCWFDIFRKRAITKTTTPKKKKKQKETENIYINTILPVLEFQKRKSEIIIVRIEKRSCPPESFFMRCAATQSKHFTFEFTNFY
jgi:hypothetical protein